MTTATPWTSTARALASDIKLAHSVFALPFAVLAACMAAIGSVGADLDWRSFIGQLALVIAAMVFARTVAMLANRLLDRRLDAANPRTANRALPGGRVTVRAALVGLATAAVSFMLVCAGFLAWFGNPWPLLLGVPVLAWISAYPLCKRFTTWCHLYLGVSLALSPLAAAVAVEPSALSNQASLYLMSVMVMTWVAGFDIIYALQDVESDRATGVLSMPARLGPRRALWVSRALHLVAVGCLVAMVRIDPRLGVAFATATGLVIALLVVEHATVVRWGTSRIALTFFTLNGVISCLLGLSGVVDLLTG